MQLEKDPALEVAESYGLLAKAFKRLKKREEEIASRLPTKIESAKHLQSLIAKRTLKV